MFICSSLNQRLSKVIITCVYESYYTSIMNKIYEPAFQMQVNTLNLWMVRPRLSLNIVASCGQGLKTNLRQTWAHSRYGVGKKITLVCAGNSKPFILIFLFHSMNATIKIFAWEFLPNRSKKSLKRKKVGKSHLLFCFQQRCLLASTDQKTKTQGITIV